MANFLFDKGKEGFLGGDIAWDTDNIKVVAGHSYAQDPADEFRADAIANGFTATATSGNLSGKTITNGVADASDISYPTVSAGPDIECLLIYKDTGSSATDRLIAYIDTGTSLPITPTGADIPVIWSPSGIFAL